MFIEQHALTPTSSGDDRAERHAEKISVLSINKEPLVLQWIGSETSDGGQLIQISRKAEGDRPNVTIFVRLSFNLFEIRRAAIEHLRSFDFRYLYSFFNVDHRNGWDYFMVTQSSGNACDGYSVVATALAVTHAAAGNIGGGGFVLIRWADGCTYVALCFRT